MKVHDYSKDASVVTRKRSAKGEADLTEHLCKLCAVARSNSLSKPVKPNPSRSQSKTSLLKKQKAVKVCSICFTEIRQGNPHRCSKEMKLRNLTRMAGSDADNFASRSLRTRVISKSDVSLKNIRGKPTKAKIVNRKTSSADGAPISVDHILRIKNQLNLSTRKVI